eukprot:TRINITY_DN12270_c0_g1_i1.p1 TRINITY_DN12270_c0_g1~~TRINITY_DN12270_c0_g1_i1.p1  ORF type:complete len:494 (+),score=134.66 TRINITY_DN12270_c0_g1_i1:1-1482(+)
MKVKSYDLIEKNKRIEIIQLFLDNSSTLFKKANEKVDDCFLLIFSYINSFGDPKKKLIYITNQKRTYIMIVNIPKKDKPSDFAISNVFNFIDDVNKNEEMKVKSYDLIEKNKRIEIIQLFLDNSSTLFKKANEKVDDCFLLIFSYINSFGEQTKEAESKIIDFLIDEKNGINENPSFHLKILRLLNHIYNVGVHRSKALLELIRYAFTHQLGKYILPILQNIDNLLKQYNVPLNSTRDIYKVIGEGLQNLKKGYEAFEYGKKYLASFEDEKEEVIEKSLDYIETIVLDGIKLPQVFELETILDFKCTSTLAKKENTKLTHQLLKIFVNDTLDQFLIFQKNNQSFISQKNLDEQVLLKKIKLLSLSSLATGKKEITFAEISEALKVEEIDVDKWVINAISSEVIDGKLDQFTRTVHIKWALNRVFLQNDWVKLNDSFNNWSHQITILKEVMNESTKVQLQVPYALNKNTSKPIPQNTNPRTKNTKTNNKKKTKN